MTMRTDEPVFPSLIPQPRQIEPLGGETELSEDVRLVTSNVLPLQRKAMRGILTGAGVRVVANKKKFVIEVSVEEFSELNLADVPEDKLDEYYELELRDNRVYIRTGTQAGALWGIHALAGIYGAVRMCQTVPNVRVRDWPDLPYRGIFVENKWGPDRMDLMDWYAVIDRLAALRMNCMGVGLYGCWGSCRYEGQPTEFLMVPIPDHPELRTEKKLRWYSAADDEWNEEIYVPYMFEEDFFGEVVTYGKEKGVTIIPFVNSLGHNTMIPRMMPAISAKDQDGTPRGIGYCLSTPQTREFVESFYGSIVERYYPEGAEFFHIELDEVWPDFADPEDPAKRVDPWCECAECRQRPREQNLQDYIVWLIRMLVSKGVNKVVMWNDQLTRHMDVLGQDFVGKLKAEGLEDRLILHWWWYSNDALNDQTRVAIGKKLGLPGWVAPMTCYFNWERYSSRRKNIELMMDMAHAEGADGAVSYAVHDVGWTDHEVLLAVYSWNFQAAGSEAEELEKWIQGRFGPHAEPFANAYRNLQEAAANGLLQHCYNYRYSYCREGMPFPREFPGEALSHLAAIEGVDVAGQLQATADTARESARAFGALVQTGELGTTEQACVKSLWGEATRIDALATVFSYLWAVRTALGTDRVDEQLVTSGSAVRGTLLSCMKVVEENKPDYVAPACLQALSVLLEFLDQLIVQLGEVQAAKRTPEHVRWTV